MAGNAGFAFVGIVRQQRPMPTNARMNLEEMLADRDFGLRMRFGRGEVATFFMPGDSHAAVIAERRKWLAAAPEVHCALLPEGIGLLDETIGLAVTLGTVPGDAALEHFASLDPLARWPAAGGWGNCGKRTSC